MLVAIAFEGYRVLLRNDILKAGKAVETHLPKDWAKLGHTRQAPKKLSVLSSGYWEVVQSAVHQPLELTILVRVQASQPIFQNLRPKNFTSV
jgi:hypothetical protein